jgi:hypothetical protein
MPSVTAAAKTNSTPHLVVLRFTPSSIALPPLKDRLITGYATMGRDFAVSANVGPTSRTDHWQRTPDPKRGARTRSAFHCVACTYRRSTLFD